MKFATIEELESYQNDNGATLSISEYEFNSADEWEEIEIINPENSQKEINALVPAEDVAYEIARKELTLTSRYHSWHNTVADKINNAIYTDGEINNDTIETDLIDVYNSAVKNENQYGSTDTISSDMPNYKIAGIIEANSH